MKCNEGEFLLGKKWNRQMNIKGIFCVFCLKMVKIAAKEIYPVHYTFKDNSNIVL